MYSALSMAQRIIPILISLFILTAAHSQDIDILPGGATAGSPLTGGDTDQTIFSFQLHKNAGGASSVSDIKVFVDQDPTNILTNVRLYRSDDATLDGGDTEVTTGTFTTIAPFSIDFSAAPITDFNGGDVNAVDRWFFVVADIDPATATTTLQPSIDESAITATSTVNSGTETGTNYTINAAGSIDLSAASGAVTSPLEAGSTDQVIFAVQLHKYAGAANTVTDFTMLLSNDPNGIITNARLYLSTDNIFDIGSDAMQDAGSLNTTPNRIDFSAAPITNFNSNSTAVVDRWFFIVVDVEPGVTSSTNTLLPSVTEAQITTSGAPVNNGTVNGTTYSFVPSNATIAVNFIGQMSIELAEYDDDETTLTSLTDGNTQRIFAIDIEDGDTDSHNTTITDLAFTVANSSNLATISLFNGATRIASQAVTGGTVSFSGLSIVVADGTTGGPNTETIDVRVTFAANVTDNQAIDVALTSATALATGSALASFAGIQTTAGRNGIDVDATKLVFVDGSNVPTTGPIEVNPGGNFSATVWALDARNNLDLDETSSITLSVSGGAGSLTGGGSQNLAGGVRTFNPISVNLAGSYNLIASDGGGPLLDASTGNGTAITLTVTSLGVLITTADLSSCVVGSANIFTALPNLVMTESDPSDFTPGTNLTYLVILPAGWEFLTPSTSSPTPAYAAPSMSFTAGRNVSAAAFSGFIGTTIARFTYSASGTNQTDELTISGLYVKNVSATSSANIYRSGTGVMAGNDETEIQGTLTPAASATATFFVKAMPNQNAIDSTETNFSISSAAIILDGKVNGTTVSGGTFSGPGVTNRYIVSPVNDYRYTFNPGSLDAGNYDIVFTYSDPGTGCISTVTRTFNVYAASVNGLQRQYCVNDNAVKSLSPNTAFIPANYSFVNYAIQFPSYKFISNVTNNGTSLTITAPDHGLQAGNTHTVYIPFTGSTVSGSYVVTNVTQNTFDINATAIGAWYGYGYFYLIQPTVTNIVNNGTSLTITAANHGLQNGSKIRITIYGMTIDAGVTNYFYGWYTVSNVTTNTFDITVTATGAWTSATINVYSYQISSFQPNMATSLNSNLTGITFYYVGLFIRRDSPANWQQGVEFVTSSDYVTINPLPVVDFSGLGSDYCASSATPVVLTGNQPDGSFSINLVGNIGLTDNGVSNNTATFLPNTPGIPTETQLALTYSYTDGNNCTNTATRYTTVHALPVVSAGADIDLCRGNSATLGGSPVATGNGPFAYNWNNSATLDDNARATPSASPIATTNYTVTVTDAYSCSNSGSLNVVVFDPPTVNLGTDPAICSGTGVPLVTSGVIGGSASSATWSTTDGTGEFRDAVNSVTSTVYGQATQYIPSLTDYNNGRITVLLTTNDPAGPCPAAVDEIVVNIKSLPVVTITSSASDLSLICQSDGTVNINASQANGNWSGTASSALFNTVPGAGSTQLNPLNLAPGTYTLRYDYTDPVSTCSNFSETSLTILPTITPSLSVGDACDGFFVDITNNSTINPPSSPSTISSISWDFGDQSSLPIRPYNDVIPDGFSTITKGTFASPSHIFRSVGSFTVNYTMTTSDGCRVTGTRQIINNEVPRAAFTWSNACFDTGTNTADLQFTGANLNLNLPPADIQSYTWNFATTSSLTYSSAGTGRTPVTTYTDTGRDIVQLVVTSVANCRDTIQKPVFIVPINPAITEDNSYSVNFDSDEGQWIAGGQNSSWQHGTPGGTVINRDSSATGTGRAWVTNLTGNNNSGEQSWVLSPCFDFSQAQKPVISLDIWSDTPRGIDGAVLQYNESGNIEDNTNWIVVGSVAGGINWYDQNGIASKPGNQLAGDVGWTGDATGGRYRGWKHAVFNLDMLIGKPNVKFRIAFASNVGSQEGFAFDNVFIGERSRTVLIESFTNSSPEANTRLYNDFFNSLATSSTEIVKIQYHTSFPGFDTLNVVNSRMNNARAAFYGITSAPSLRIDGKFGAGPIASWAPSLYSDEVLEPSPLKIDIAAPVKNGGIVRINSTITNVAGAPLPLRDVHVFTVVLEKNIDTQPWIGNGGDLQFNYVARDILPSPSGVPINRDLGAGEVYEMPELIWDHSKLTKPDNAAIAIFVQSIQGDGKNVYQAKLYDNPPQPDVVTSVTEPSIYKQARVYPNPSDQAVNIELPVPSSQLIPVKLFDSFGREVYSGSFRQGERTKAIMTKEFAAGIYYLQFGNSGESGSKRKVMVVHP